MQPLPSGTPAAPLGPSPSPGRAPPSRLAPAALPFFGARPDSKQASPAPDSQQQPSSSQQPHFDLALAVVLAGAAFEAYLQPKVRTDALPRLIVRPWYLHAHMLS